MKNLKQLLVAFTSILLVSCNFTETLYINEDGTGKFAVDMDGSQLLSMMPEDSLQSQKVMDTTVSFKSFLDLKKDSISKLPLDQQARLKKLENFVIRTTMNPQKKEFLFSMTSDFKSVADLQDAMSTMDAVQGANKSNKELTGGKGFGDNNSELKYSYDGKTFSRKATLKQKEILEVEQDSMKQAMNMFYESSTYTVKYHFPKKVKKVSIASALYSEDRKTITIEFPFSDYMKEPEKLNFEVEFEK